MPACTCSAVSMVADCLASDDSEATARRTGFVTRASKSTGKLFLARVTFAAWSEAKTTWAQWAAKVTHIDKDVDVSPEAMHHRMHKKAIAFLQDMIRQALAKVQSLERVGDDGLFTYFTKVSIADSTGFALPAALHKTFPGAGGVQRKLAPKFTPSGPRKAGCLVSLR